MLSMLEDLSSLILYHGVCSQMDLVDGIYGRQRREVSMLV
jgi:hypothetical protein